MPVLRLDSSIFESIVTLKASTSVNLVFFPSRVWKKSHLKYHLLWRFVFVNNWNRTRNSTHFHESQLNRHVKVLSRIAFCSRASPEEPLCLYALKKPMKLKNIRPLKVNLAAKTARASECPTLTKASHSKASITLSHIVSAWMDDSHKLYKHTKSGNCTQLTWTSAFLRSISLLSLHEMAATKYNSNVHCQWVRIFT